MAQIESREAGKSPEIEALEKELAAMRKSRCAQARCSAIRSVAFSRCAGASSRGLRSDRDWNNGEPSACISIQLQLAGDPLAVEYQRKLSHTVLAGERRRLCGVFLQKITKTLTFASLKKPTQGSNSPAYLGENTHGSTDNGYCTIS